MNIDISVEIATKENRSDNVNKWDLMIVFENPFLD